MRRHEMRCVALRCVGDNDFTYYSPEVSLLTMKEPSFFAKHCNKKDLASFPYYKSSVCFPSSSTARVEKE